MPRAAALRKIAPTFVWSTMSSHTTTLLAPSSTSSTLGSGVRARDASAPRCTWKPVTCSAISSGTTKHGASVRCHDVGQPVQPAGCHQEGADREAGQHGSSYDLLALGQEQPVLGLEGLPELHVPEVPIVGESRVLGVGDLDVRRHGQGSRCG